MFSSWHRIPCFTKYTYKYVRITYVSFPPEFWPEFLSPEFWTKLILPWNDLIPTCVPTESGNAAEFRGFRKMTPSRNRNRNGMHILDWIYVIDQRQCHSLYEPRSAIVPHPRPCRDESNKPRKAETKCICHVQHRGLEEKETPTCRAISQEWHSSSGWIGQARRIKRNKSSASQLDKHRTCEP